MATEAVYDEDFRQTLVSAAYEARKAREIGPLEYLRIVRHSRNAEFQQAAKDVIYNEAKMSPQPVAALDEKGTIDWTKLLGFIQQVLPLILQLIGLFGG